MKQLEGRNTYTPTDISHTRSNCGLVLNRMDTRTTRTKGNTVCLSMSEFLQLGKKYVISNPSRFVIEIRPYAESLVARTLAFSKFLIRRAIRDGNTVVLALKHFLMRGDVCKIVKVGDVIQIWNQTAIEKYNVHHSLMHPKEPEMEKLPKSTLCPKCRSSWTQKVDGIFQSCVVCNYSVLPRTLDSPTLILKKLSSFL